MQTLSAVFLHLLNMSITAGWIVLAVAVLRLLLRRAPRALVCGLWILVAVRLVCPFSFESVLSLIPSAETVPPDIAYTDTPMIQSGIPILNNAVNEVLDNTVTPAPGDSVNPLQRLLPAAALLWVAGMAAMLLYALVSYLRMRRRVRVSMPAGENVRLCDHIATPFILGFFRPLIYLPASLETAQKDYVTAHEQAHIKRHDHWWKPLGFLLLAVYWFHPLLWVAYILLCRDIEIACDEQVIRHMESEDKEAYATTLLHCSIPRRTIAACPLAFGEVGIKGRIKSVLHYRKPTLWILLVGLAVSTVAAVCLLTDPPQKYTDAELLAMVQQITENKTVAHSSNATDYIEASPVLYEKLLAGDKDTVDCFVRALRRTPDHGLEEYIMASTCAQITGIGHHTLGWSSAGEWLALYDGTPQIDVRISRADHTGNQITLSPPDSRTVTLLVSKNNWQPEQHDCPVDYVLDIQGRQITYSSGCGTLGDQARTLLLPEETRLALNTLLAQYVTLSTDATDTVQPPTLSEDQALQNVQQLEPPGEGLYYECDGLVDHSFADGSTIRAYVFRVYSLSKEPLEGDQGEYRQPFTKGWYMVDADTGKVYDYITGRPVAATTTKAIIPLTTTTTHHKTYTTTAASLTTQTPTSTTAAILPAGKNVAHFAGVRRQNTLTIDGVDLWERLFGDPAQKPYVVLQRGDELQYRLYDPPAGTRLECTIPVSHREDAKLEERREGDLWKITAVDGLENVIYYCLPTRYMTSVSVIHDGWGYTERVCGHWVYVINSQNRLSHPAMVRSLLAHYGVLELYMDYQKSASDSPHAQVDIPITEGTAWISEAIRQLEQLAAKGYEQFWIDGETSDSGQELFSIYVTK